MSRKMADFRLPIPLAGPAYSTITENHLRFEFFDLANNIDFSTPNATLTSTSFERITRTATSGFARILQFALKYYF